MNINKGIVKDINHLAQSVLFDKIRNDYPNYDMWWRKVLKRNCWFSIENNELIAACIVKIENKKDCNFLIEEDRIIKICLLSISEKHKNKGIGSEILNKVEAFSIENSINCLYATTKSKNIEIINFFLKKKFQVVKIINKEIYLQKIFLDNYIEINKKAYEALSNEYKYRGKVKSVYEETPSYLVENILNILPNETSFNVLEVGPGSGEIVEEFEKKGNRTTAIEISSKISHLIKEKSPQTIIINSNILDVNFFDAQFDIIYAGAFIHLFNEYDAQKVLRKISSWLKCNGLLFVNTTISRNSEEGFYYKSDYKLKIKRFRRKWRESDFQTFIENKFIIEKTLYTNELDRGKVWVGYICKKRKNEK